MVRRRASLAWFLLARIALALSLAAPHAGHAAGQRAGDGLTLVICGAAGAYEITLDDPEPPAPRIADDPCCMMGCPGLPPMATAAPGVWARPAAPPPIVAPSQHLRLTYATRARDPPTQR